MAALRQRADDERVLDSFQTRIAAVRSELRTWKALHTKMWKAFGLAASSDRTRTGAGGGTLDAGAPNPEAESRPSGELDLLATSVADEGPRKYDRIHAASTRCTGAAAQSSSSSGCCTRSGSLRPT